MFNLSFDKEKQAASGNGSRATSKIPFITLADKTCLLLGWPFYLRLSLLPSRFCFRAVSVMRGAGLRILLAAITRSADVWFEDETRRVQREPAN